MKKVEKSHNMPFVAGWGSINASPQNSNKNIILFIKLIKTIKYS